MSVTKDVFGETKDGKTVERYTLSNSHNIKVDILTLGGIVQRLFVPDRNGKIDDIVTGYDTVAEYEENPAYFGAIIGRVANRIHKGKFTLDGQEYSLAVNNGPNHLHGGPGGFHTKLYTATVMDGKRLQLQRTSEDGEEGYPGAVDVSVTYQLTDDCELLIEYMATSSRPTPINLTNHTYYNLAGHDHGDIYEQVVTVFSEKFTPKNEDNVPTGELANVAGTVFDLRESCLFKEHINEIPDDIGYDHNFCVEGEGEKKLAARVEDPGSGRVLEVFTSAPGVHLYTGNYLDMVGKGGATYRKHSAFCFETQNYPDAINKPNFPNSVLRPGQTYKYSTWMKFSTASTGQPAQ